MKKASCTVLVAMILTGLFLIAFTDNAVSQTKSIELKLAQWDPPKAIIAQLTQKMADRINEQSGGRLKVKTFFGETLLKQVDSDQG